MNKIPLKRRVQELLIDYLVIIVYLAILLILNLGMIYFVFGKTPEYTELQAQLIATCTSVIPIILMFSYLDYYKGGSIGKRVARLKITYAHRKFSSSVLRNIVKFLPWQLGHIGVIHGVYSDFDVIAIMIANCGVLFGLILLYMGLFGKDQRHMGDLLAGTKVELKQDM